MDLTPEQVVEQISNRVAEATKGFASNDDVKSMKEELASVKTLIEATPEDTITPQIDAVKSAIAGLEGKLEAIKEAPKASSKFKHLGEAIFNAYKDASEIVGRVASKEVMMASLDVKAADTMTINGNYSGGTVGLSDLESGVARVVRRRPFMRQLSNTRGTTSKYVVWVEQKNPDPGVAGMVGEGAAKPQTDFDLVENSCEVKKIAAFIKVSKEMLADLPFMQGEINGELMELVELKLDQQILLGTGAGDDMTGIDLNAVAFAAGTLAGTVPTANNSDVLRAALAQLALANFEGNYIVMNPADVAAMELSKGTDGTYTYPMFVPQLDGITRVKNVPIVENNLVPADTFYVGDFTKSNLRIREEMNLQVGYVNDDFTKNLVTVLCEMRACHYVKTNYYGAFIKGQFSVAKAALLLP